MLSVLNLNVRSIIKININQYKKYTSFQLVSLKGPTLILESLTEIKENISAVLGKNLVTSHFDEIEFFN